MTDSLNLLKMNLYKILYRRVDTVNMVKISIPLVILFVSIINLYVWFFNLYFLNDSGNLPAISLTSCFMFVLSAICMYINDTWRKILFGVVLAFSSIIIIDFIIRNLNNNYIPISQYIPILGVYSISNYPSILSIIGFLLFYISLIFKVKYFNSLLFILVFVSFIGYFLQNKFLFGYIENYNSGLSIHSSILFLHLASWLLYRRI